MAAPSSTASQQVLQQGDEDGPAAFRLLILGGTTEASALARALAGREDIAPLLSLAGRTANPITPPIPHRIGGFGGVEGLAEFLRRERIAAVVDATHPFAARISANAAAASREANVPLLTFTRPPWAPLIGPTDKTTGATQWISVPDLDAAVAWLDQPSRRVFLTTGRVDLARFRAAPQHHYLVRTIDAPDPDDLPPDSTVLFARGPFRIDDEIALMQAHAVDLLVTKNSGAAASSAKLEAARTLGIAVLMVERPPPSGAPAVHDLDVALAWIDAQRARP